MKTITLNIFPEVPMIADSQKSQLCAIRVEKELIRQERSTRYIRAARKAIKMMNEGNHRWGYNPGSTMLCEVWRWNSVQSGFTVRLVDTKQADRNTVYDDIAIQFYDSGEIVTTYDFQ